ncbi:MAG: hypothetical protein MPL62_09750 [Alphaproteobacteria bacterium]|nr:hypothetical protein [Alphaproteobacteria bacterium]
MNTTKPHIVKFSGGRSSGMMLMQLLHQGKLRPERGDVIVFNNTSAEHPATYDFTRRMKEFAEREYNIPFFWIEYQTYEDAGKHGWARHPTYRLVNALPYSDSNKTGYRSGGEVFEELVSLTGFVPNMLNRLCTQWLKIFVTNAFLADWFAQKPGIEHLGHRDDTAKMSDEEVVRIHQGSRGETPESILLKKKSFVRARDHVRAKALWQDFTDSKLCFENKKLKKSIVGRKGQLFGKKAIEYVSCLGIRGDESVRVDKIRDRIAAVAEKRSASLSQQPPKESILAPLVDSGISQEDVLDFWNQQEFNLALPDTGLFSNCVYCPLKGKRKLLAIAALELSEETDLRGTPASIDWWVEMEEKYARDLKAEKRAITSKKDVEYAYVGFFGAAHDLVYQQLKEQATHLAQDAERLQAEYLEAESYAPCNCTD